MRTMDWKNGKVSTIDQSKLPNETTILTLRSCDEIGQAIRTMKIRGAPLLGIAAAYGLALTAHHSEAKTKAQLLAELEASAKSLRSTRPTAVNLFWALDRIIAKAKKTAGNARTVEKAVVEEAQNVATEDIEANRRMGKHGSKLIEDGDTILTHCNAGSLATGGFGTALGVIRAAWKDKKKIKVIATETRPLLQGARLTSYELSREDIPVTLITDSMVGYVMAKGLINKVIVGADRIVRDAVINKIGTYTISVLASEHKIPFYVAAPRSTLDIERSAKDVTVEQRDEEEVLFLNQLRIAPKGVHALNPSFDITPLKYVTGIICEKGVISPTSFQNLRSKT